MTTNDYPAGRDELLEAIDQKLGDLAGLVANGRDEWFGAGAELLLGTLRRAVHETKAEQAYQRLVREINTEASDDEIAVESGTAHKIPAADASLLSELDAGTLVTLIGWIEGQRVPDTGPINHPCRALLAWLMDCASKVEEMRRLAGDTPKLSETLRWLESDEEVAA